MSSWRAWRDGRLPLLRSGRASGGRSLVALVPWRVLEPETKVDAPLVLFWIPASVEELRHSELLTSDDLTLFSSQCVAMHIIRLNDQARLTSLAEDVTLPVVCWSTVAATSSGVRRARTGSSPSPRLKLSCARSSTAGQLKPNRPWTAPGACRGPRRRSRGHAVPDGVGGALPLPTPGTRGEEGAEEAGRR